MTEYIYFVKCPDCDDESFMFLDEAKDFATSCLSRKPIITQTEVCRNDFGECTDHCDLGTIWSWEEAVGDVTCDEPVVKIFTSGDFADYDPDTDPEFTSLDNSCDHFDNLDSAPDNFRKPAKSNHDELAEDYVNKFIIVGEKEDYSKQFYNVEAKEWVAKSEDATLFDNRNAAVEVLHDVDPVYFYTTHIMIKPIPAAAEESTGKPIPEGMTIEQLVEEMEENEDEVECTWCNDLFNKSVCRKAVGRGWLCYRCEAAIKSRGETLTFKENNYWDFLDEDVELTEAVYRNIINLPDAKTQILEIAKLDTRAVDYINNDNTINPAYAETGNGPVGNVTDFVVNERGELIIHLDRGNGRSNDLELDALMQGQFFPSGLRRACPAYKLLAALREAARTLNRRVGVAGGRNLNVRAALRDNAAVADELKGYISDIQFSMPPHGDYDVDAILNIDPTADKKMADRAADKLNTIYNNFYNQPFADNAAKAGKVDTREPDYRADWIVNCWGGEGVITFRGPISALSKDATDLIDNARYNAKTALDTSKKSVNCFRLACELIRYFGNNPEFYKG